MSFLILDTDKQSTQSLRAQLAEISDHPIEVGDAAALLALKKSDAAKMPEIIFLDQDGDPKKVEAISDQLELGNVGSSVVVLGSTSKTRFARHFDSYVRKPIFPRRLKKTLIDSFAHGQQRRSVVGYIGTVPVGLVRELSRGTGLWKRIIKINPAEPRSAGGSETLSEVGAVFVVPEGLSTAELALVRKIYKDPVGTRATVVGVGKDPGKISAIRNSADFFVDEESDWETVLDRIARFRLSQLRSEMSVEDAKERLERGSLFFGAILLRRALMKDPWNIKAQTLLAEFAFARKKPGLAAAYYRKILELNPCLPRPYLKLMEIEKKLQGNASENTLELARRFCPKLKQLQSPGPS